MTQKPAGINVTTGLMCVLLFVGVGSMLTLKLPAPDAKVQVSPETLQRSVYVVTAVVTGISALCIFFYWKGHNWARWLAIFQSAYGLYSLIHLKAAWRISAFSAVVVVIDAALGAYLLWYLNRPEVRQWFVGESNNSSTGR